MLAIERHCLTASGSLAVAVIENYLGRPFGQQKPTAGSILVQGRHKAVLRFERYRVDPRVGGLLGLPFETKLVAKWVEGPLGRVAFHFPCTLFAVDRGIVAEHRDPPHQL